MSDTYDIFCEDCKRHFWAGQRGGGAKTPRLYGNIEHLSDFLSLHVGHHLTYRSGMSAIGYEEWRPDCSTNPS